MSSAAASHSVTPDTNKAKIHTLNKSLFEAECNVLNNVAEESLTRAISLENQDLIKRNFHGAFIGNRATAIANCDSALRSKLALIKAQYHGDDPVKQNHIEILLARAKLEALDQRSKRNECVNSVNAAMVAANAQLIEINKQVMEITDGIVESSGSAINDIKHLLSAKDKSVDTATPESNTKLIAECFTLLHSVGDRAAQNKSNNEQIRNTTTQNYENIEANSASVASQRARVQQDLAALTAVRPSVKLAL